MLADRQLNLYPPRQTRNRLGRVKCRFCREAKQKCEPIGRQWPGQKCRRCLEKNLHCSEGQLAKKSTRRASNSIQALTEPRNRQLTLAPKGSVGGVCHEQLPAYNPLPFQHMGYDSTCTVFKGILNTNTAPEDSARVRRSLVLLSLHTVLIMALQELKDLCDSMSSMFQKDPYRFDAAHSLRKLESTFSEYKQFARSIQKRYLCIGGGELLVQALAALETDYDYHSITLVVEDSPNLAEETVAKFQEVGHHGFAHVLHMKRLLNRPLDVPLGRSHHTNEEIQQLVQSRDLFLTEVKDTLQRDFADESLTEMLLNSQIFVPSKLLKYSTIMEHVYRNGMQDCLQRSISHILADTGYSVDWPMESVNHVDTLGRSALYLACQNGNEALTKSLINKQRNLNQRALNGLTPLHVAACQGHTDICRVIWQCQIRSDEPVHYDRFRDGVGWSPLLWAVLCGRQSTVERILEMTCKWNLHADIRKDQDNFGCTSLTLAACGGQDQVVACLLAKGFPTDIPDIKGRTPFWYATWGSHCETMKLLLDFATLDRCDHQGRTPLAEAARLGHSNALKYLLGFNQYGQFSGEPLLVRVGLGSKDNEGKSPLILATENGKWKCVRLLRNHDTLSSDHLQTKDMQVAIRIACQRATQRAIYPRLPRDPVPGL